MKKNQAEQWLLLEASGELNVWQRWRLQRALARHPGLQQFRADLQQLTSTSRATPPIGELAPELLGAIRQAAAEQQQAGCAVSTGDAAWLKHAVALTAILVILGGLTLINQYRPMAHAPQRSLAGVTAQAWGEDIDQELDQVSQLLASNFELGPDVTPDDDSMARELLLLEGTEQ